MSDFDAATRALGAFPIVQAAVALVVVLTGVFMMRRGERDRKEVQPPAVPQWLMMGPAHDAIGALHDVAEQSRQQTELLKRIEALQKEQVAETVKAKGVLEAIRNESRLR